MCELLLKNSPAGQAAHVPMESCAIVANCKGLAVHQPIPRLPHVRRSAWGRRDKDSESGSGPHRAPLSSPPAAQFLPKARFQMPHNLFQIYVFTDWEIHISFQVDMNSFPLRMGNFYDFRTYITEIFFGKIFLS